MALQDPEDYNKYWDINEDYLRASSEALADPDYQPEQSQLHQEQATLERRVDRKRKREAMEAVPRTPRASAFAARTVLEKFNDVVGSTAKQRTSGARPLRFHSHWLHPESREILKIYIRIDHR
ncbi:hypothetical protein C8J57DRAFT_1256783 [Mycena rebaudengoi]|nr:hypothetical protein C8J57DRAFT_1256783 [Mycena rebaudengoi]